MPTYIYRAKSFSGEQKTGTMEAKDQHELAKLLHEQGYVLISAVLKETDKKRRLDLSFLQKLGRIPLRDKLMLVRNLQVMIAAGISLPRALKTLAVQTKSKRFQRALINISEEIKQGKNFSDALKKYPDIFSDLFYYMVKVGEESGTLEEVLKNLALQMEREHELKSKVKSALIYPTIIIIVMIIIAILMLILVVPKLAQVFKDLKMELPFTTKLVIGLGTFLSNQLFFLVIVVLLLCLFFRFALKLKRGKKIKDALLLRIPVISPLIKKVNASYMIRTLGILIASGVSFLRALEIVAGVLPNIYFKEAILEAKEEVKKGGKLSKALRKYQNIFPPTVIDMLEVGEETGETSKILEELANFFEEEVTIATKNLVSVIEPVLMVLVGVTVGFFAISMIQPIYSMLGGF